MNIDALKNNAGLHAINSLKKINRIVADQFSFIEDNALHITKKDYVTLYAFLMDAVKQFKNMDLNYMNSTLTMLLIDIDYIYKLYQEQIYNTDNSGEFFETKVMQKITLFIQIKEKIKELKESEMMKDPKLKDTMDESFSELKKHHNGMKSIYLRLFEEEFLPKNQDTIHNLEIILNTKLFYLDKLLWRSANQSRSIKRTFKTVAEIEEINAIAYMSFKLKSDSLSKRERQYLIKCKRMY